MSRAQTECLGRAHILLVDDDAKMRPLYLSHLGRCHFLEPEGFAVEIHWAESAGRALEIASRIVGGGDSIGCALIDLLLGPGRDGVDTMLALWEMDPDAQCTLITAARRIDETETLRRIPPRLQNRWDFVAKPFTRLEITQRVRRSLSSWMAFRNERRHEAQNAHLVELLAEKNLKLEESVRERTAVLAERNRELETKNRELEEALRDLEMAQSQVLQNEKMACIGQLAAGIAHELNNPIGFVHSNLGTLGRYVDKIRAVLDAYEAALPRAGTELETLRETLKIDFVLGDLPDLVAESLEGTERVRKIVHDLKVFSHTGRERRYVDLNECLTSTLNIIHNELKYKANVTVELGELPLVHCVPGQINQVFMNLLMNACQALDGVGEIRVSTRAEADAVRVAVSDTGRGIPESVLPRIFDPFFTTKGIGAGTGLGLSITYDIVREHGGTIAVESQVGAGTTFRVVLPVARDGDDPGEA